MSIPHGFKNGTLYCTNVDFRGQLPVQDQMTQNGQLLIGAAVAPFIRAGFLASADASVTITNGAGTIDLSALSALDFLVLNGNSGTASPSGGVLNINANSASNQCGSSVLFINSGNTSQLNLMDQNGSIFLGAGSGNILSTNSVCVGLGLNCLTTEGANQACVAIGFGSMQLGTALVDCVGLGLDTLGSSTQDQECVAIGNNCLSSLDGLGASNGTTAVGHGTLSNIVNDARNTACGNRVLEVLQGIVDESANDNTAFGYQAGKFLSRGSGNILIGSQSGTAYDSSESFNILIGSGGVQGESSVLRIGDITDSGLLNGLTACYIQGIYNNSQLVESTSQVMTINNTSGRIGVTTLTFGGDDGSAQFDESLIFIGTNFNSGSSVFFENDTNVSILRLTDSNQNTLLGRECGVYNPDPDLRSSTMTGAGYRCFSQAGADAIRCVGFGPYVMADATQPYECVGIGYGALRSWDGGSDFPGVVAVGSRALFNCFADAGNIAVGYRCLTTLNGLALAENNTCVGHDGFIDLQSGAFNLGLGANVGSQYATNESSNILLNSPGVLNDSNTFRAGKATGSGAQELNRAFISGINGVTLGGSPLMVVIDPTTDQLGVQNVPPYLIKIIVGDTSNGANYSTISAAIAAASFGEVIGIQAGTYTEDFTLANDISLVSLGVSVGINASAGGPVKNTKIIGKISAVNGTGTISGIALETNGDHIAEVTGTGNLSFFNCYCNATDTVPFAISNASGNIFLENCSANLDQVGLSLYNILAGNFWAKYSYFYNQGGSTTIPTLSSGKATFDYCYSQCPLACASTGEIKLETCEIETFSTGGTGLTTGGSSASFVNNCNFNTGGGTAISIGSGTTVFLTNSTIKSVATNVIDGAGTLYLGSVDFNGSSASSAISTSTVNYLTSATGNINAKSVSFDGGVNQLQNFVDVTSFTPAIQFGGASTGITYAARSATYTRLGRTITFQMSIELSNKGSATGDATITGLPVGAPNTNILNVSASSLTFSGMVNARLPGGSSSTISLDQWASGGSRAPLTDTAFNNSTFIQVSGSYVV